MATEALVHALEDMAPRLRIDSIRATTAARSGHPTSAASAADIVAALFFSVMRSVRASASGSRWARV